MCLVQNQVDNWKFIASNPLYMQVNERNCGGFNSTLISAVCIKLPLIIYFIVNKYRMYNFNYLLSRALSRAITVSSNLIINVVPLCQWTVTFDCWRLLIREREREIIRNILFQISAYKIALVQDSLDYARDISRAVQTAFIFGNRDELVDDRFFLNYVIYW